MLFRTISQASESRVRGQPWKVLSDSGRLLAMEPCDDKSNPCGFLGGLHAYYTYILYYTV